MADTYGARIRAARKKAGLKQEYIERKLGCSHGYISNYERDLRKPKLETLEKFAELFECDVSDLIPYKTTIESSNPYWENICVIADNQRAKGMHKYGHGLEENTDDMLKRIKHLQEELIDGLMYCEWIKDELLRKGESDD